MEFTSITWTEGLAHAAGASIIATTVLFLCTIVLILSLGGEEPPAAAHRATMNRYVLGLSGLIFVGLVAHGAFLAWNVPSDDLGQAEPRKLQRWEVRRGDVEQAMADKGIRLVFIPDRRFNEPQYLLGMGEHEGLIRDSPPWRAVAVGEGGHLVPCSVETSGMATWRGAPFTTDCPVAPVEPILINERDLEPSGVERDSAPDAEGRFIATGVDGKPTRCRVLASSEGSLLACGDPEVLVVT